MPREIGMLLLGIAVGTLIQRLPSPLDLLQPYVWIVFLALGIVLLVKE